MPETKELTESLVKHLVLSGEPIEDRSTSLGNLLALLLVSGYFQLFIQELKIVGVLAHLLYEVLIHSLVEKELGFLCFFQESTKLWICACATRRNRSEEFPCCPIDLKTTVEKVHFEPVPSRPPLSEGNIGHNDRYCWREESLKDIYPIAGVTHSRLRLAVGKGKAARAISTIAGITGQTGKTIWPGGVPFILLQEVRDGFFHEVVLTDPEMSGQDPEPPGKVGSDPRVVRLPILVHGLVLYQIASRRATENA
jgi:hypothetical protein